VTTVLSASGVNATLQSDFHCSKYDDGGVDILLYGGGDTSSQQQQQL
jgi:hypothetical protein